jgi:hypothetical protein
MKLGGGGGAQSEYISRPLEGVWTYGAPINNISGLEMEFESSWT